MAEIKIVPGSIEILRLSDKEYFSDVYEEYISNSKLSLIDPEEDGSIEKFLAGFKSEYSESFELGGAIHANLLQASEFQLSNIRKPSAKLGVFAIEVFYARQSGKTIEESILIASEKANYYKGKLTKNLRDKAIKSCLPFYLKKISEEKTEQEVIYLSENSANKYYSCMASIDKSNFREYLYPKGIFVDPTFFNEYAILCEIEVTTPKLTKIIKFKGKLDNFTLDNETSKIVLNDLKTTSKPVNFFMGNTVKNIDENGVETEIFYEGSFQKYKYYRQLAIYLWLLQNAFNQDGKKYSFSTNILLVETLPNFKTKVCPVSSSYIKKGLKEFKDLLILVAENV